MAPTLPCPVCGGMTRFADAPCLHCGETGKVPACAWCAIDVVDPMFAPACSSLCRESWETHERHQQLQLQGAP